MTRTLRSTTVVLGALLTVGALAFPVQAAPAPPRANLPDIEDEVMCTICGTLLEESESPQANSERALIRRLIAEGETKDQIKDALVAQYGPAVLATPSVHGFDLVAWIVPGLAILVASVVIGIGVRRTTKAGRGSPPQPLDPAEAERLDADLARQDR